MCGIVGYVGPDDALPIVLEGLRRLEYRGYDSAGVAVVDGGLEVVKREGKLAEWYESSHGERGETYQGEADFYGQEVWELTAKDWMSGSELALALLKFDAEDRLSKPLELHWGRRVHLFSNQLLLDEVPLCLRQARGYLAHRDASPRNTRVMHALDEYFTE